MNDKSLSCILLAAGLSRRMGEANKLLLRTRGRTMVARVAGQLSTFPFCETLAVIGYEAEAISQELKSSGFRSIVNGEYEKGRASSVLAGLRALKESCDGVVIALADQIHLTHEDIVELHQAFNMTEASILVPFYQGKRGNPIILGSEHIEKVLASVESCRSYIDRHPEEVYRYEARSEHFVVDVDTPEDWQKYSPVAE